MGIHPSLVGHQLHRAAHAMGLAFEKALRPLDITPSQAGVLLSIDRNPDAALAELARFIAITPQTLHRIVVGLERRGLVQRDRKAGDQKSFYLSLTSLGTELLRQAEVILNAEQSVIGETFEPKEMETLYALLKRLEAVFPMGKQRKAETL